MKFKSSIANLQYHVAVFEYRCNSPSDPTNPISPLQYNDEQAYAVIQLAKHRQPLVIANMIMAGMSGPLALPGLMVLLNAEILGGLVLSQLAGPGTPVIYGSTSASMDMGTTIDNSNFVAEVSKKSSAVYIL